MAPLTATVVLGDRGRMVLPSSIRSELGLEAGTKMSLVVEDDGSIRLRSFAAVAEAARGMWAHIADPDVSWVDELIAERRAEAAREDHES